MQHCPEFAAQGAFGCCSGAELKPKLSCDCNVHLQVTLPDAGHLQFLDASERLQQSICAAGRGLSNKRVAAASGVAAAALIRSATAVGASRESRENDAASEGERVVREVSEICRKSLDEAGLLRFEVEVT